jgi:hypothetical protein
MIECARVGARSSQFTVSFVAGESQNFGRQQRCRCFQIATRKKISSHYSTGTLDVIRSPSSVSRAAAARFVAIQHPSTEAHNVTGERVDEGLEAFNAEHGD